MFSVQDTRGEAAEITQGKIDLVKTIYQDWAGNNPHRLKQLALLQLSGDGWTNVQIAKSLNTDRHCVYRSIKRARASIVDFIKTKQGIK